MSFGKQHVYTVHQALTKAMKYCAYQERCQSEVYKKLRDWGMTHNDSEEVLAELISEDFINEQRYTESFVRGKLRSKGWGKLKISYKLKEKQISNYNIELALNEVSQDEYLGILEKEAKTKLNLIKSKPLKERKASLLRFLQSRGFENNLIWDWINNNL
jgi:regulatory protein